jgi:hypothetical protein
MDSDINYHPPRSGLASLAPRSVPDTLHRLVTISPCLLHRLIIILLPYLVMSRHVLAIFLLQQLSLVTLVVVCIPAPFEQISP